MFENTIEEETNQDGFDSLSTDMKVSSKNEYYIDVVRAKEQLDLTDLSFFLRDSSGFQQ